jgi:hypothetical protein
MAYGGGLHEVNVSDNFNEDQEKGKGIPWQNLDTESVLSQEAICTQYGSINSRRLC